MRNRQTAEIQNRGRSRRSHIAVAALLPEMVKVLLQKLDGRAEFTMERVSLTKGEMRIHQKNRVFHLGSDEAAGLTRFQSFLVKPEKGECVALADVDKS